MYELIKQIYSFVAFWEPQELCVPDVEKDKLTDTILDMPRKATIVLQSDKDDSYYIAVKSEWFNEFITEHMGNVHDCYIAKISGDCTSISILEEEVSQINPAADETGHSDTPQEQTNIPPPRNVDDDSLVDDTNVYEEDDDAFPTSNTVPSLYK